MIMGISAFLACDPMKDVYEELDKNPTEISADLEFTLEDDDYELSGIESAAKYKSFSNIDDAKEGIPKILAEKYPQLGAPSSALVGYKLYVGSPEGLSDYTYADEYKVVESDYYSVSTEAGDAGFFNNSTKAEDNVPGILSANIVDPEDGKKVAVSYKFADKEYEDISGVTIFEEDFESYVVPDLGTIQTFSIVGDDQEWISYSSSAGYQAGNMSGYSYPDNVPNEDWMVLPQIDLDGFSKAELKLNQVLNFLGAGVIGTDIAVKISTDYDGADPLTATWTNLDFDKFPAGDSWDAVESKVSLANYADQKIFIAFYYKSTIDFAPNWRVISVAVEEGEAVATDTKNVFYEYDAGSTSWSAAGDEVYYLAASDYDAMGSPGRYNNFSSSDPASNYLPQMLSGMYPYAQEGQQLFVIYRYYSSSAGETQTRGDLYTFSNTWTYAPSTIETVMQLGMNGKVWEPDNTIKYEMTSDDYTAVSEAYEDSNSAGSSSMAQYGNYDINLWSDAEILESIGMILKDNFPASDEGQKYLVSYNVWTGSSGETRTLHVILSSGAYVPVGSE